MGNDHLNLATMAVLFADENKAREFIEKKRWPAGPVCPHCACTDIYKLTPKEGSKRPVRPGVYKCKACRKQFTVRIGTIFEESKIPLSKWLMAIHLMTSSKKGVSSHQIARECGITVKSAWFLTHRVREAMTKEPMAGMLRGTVEADETWVGGKPRPGTGPRKPGKTSKTPVMLLVERDGSAFCKPIAKVNRETLKDEIAVRVAKDAVLNTDEGRWYPGTHENHRKVNHHREEYSRIDPDGQLVTTNTAESFFALLKRVHYGIFHQLSKKHLHRYCNEFTFRWDHRKVSDGDRMVAAIEAAEGKRLYYREPMRKKPA